MSSIQEFTSGIGQSLAVQVVLAVLALTSLASWTVIVHKWLAFRALRRALRDHTGELAPPPGYCGLIHTAALKAAAHGGRAFSARRIGLAAQTALQEVAARLDAGLPFLASVSAASPYVGLLGTVAGIVEVFNAFAASGDLSVVQVAPGIAQALIATGAGLIAAIPALVAHNALRARADALGDAYESYANMLVLTLSEGADAHASAQEAR